MSRWLYTFAVVQPKLAKTLKECSDYDHLHEALRAHVLSEKPWVACYYQIMDGWNATHQAVAESVGSISPLLHDELELMGTCSWFIKPRDVIGDLSSLKPSMHPDDPGAYSERIFVEAMLAWAGFVRAIDGFGLLAARRLFASYGDEEYLEFAPGRTTS